MASKKEVFFAWFWVGLCALSIFLIVPLARAIQQLVQENWGASLFGYAVIFAVASGFLAVLYVLWARLKIRSFANFAWLSIIAAAYIYFTIQLWDRPEEAVHFLEYGLLGFLLFRAFRLHIDDKSIYLASFFAGSLVGIFDEILQWIVPLRYWDFRDVGLNALSCGLFQIALWRGIRPELPSTRLKPKSLRIISSLLAANIFLLGLCLSNTPERVKSYSKQFSFLSFLQNEEPMNEFKHKHRDPEIGIFFSRLTLDELKRTDRKRAEEFAGILWEWETKDYGEFLRSFPGFAHPFLHEIRVHIFRRDKRFSRAFDSGDPEERKENFLIAYKENLILEKYFNQTLHKSPYLWPEQRILRIKSEVDTNVPYRSPVSAGVFVSLKEKTVWIIFGVMMFVLLLLNIWYSRRSERLSIHKSVTK